MSFIYVIYSGLLSVAARRIRGLDPHRHGHRLRLGRADEIA